VATKTCWRQGPEGLCPEAHPTSHPNHERKHLDETRQERLRNEIPAGVLEMLSGPGLHPAKVLRLYKDLGIASLADLEAAAKDDLIKKAKGLGTALQTKILQNLAISKGGEGRHHMHLHRAAALLQHAKVTLERKRPELKQVTIAGDFRRGCELVANLALVAETPDREKKPGILESSGLQVYIAGRKHFGAALLHATCSPEHSFEPSRKRRECDLPPTAFIGAAPWSPARRRTLPRPRAALIEPELREGRGEIERALKGTLLKLVTDDDLHGILHSHTDASDGTETLEKMDTATLERDFEYFGVADHSQVGALRWRVSVEQIDE
jgi:DNA polymerase (family 10)